MTAARRAWIFGPLLLVLAVAAVPAARVSALRSAGHALVAEDAIGPADAVVVAIDAGRAGVLEAADLAEQGISARVALFAEPPDETDREFALRGLQGEIPPADAIRQLKALGVADVEVIPEPVAGTEDVGAVLPRWCRERGYRSVVIVTTADHSRRMRRVLNRTAGAAGVRASVRVSRYSAFDPDRWWETRAGVRTGIVELQKLALDVLRHPLS